MKRALSVVTVLALSVAGLCCASVTVYVSWPSPGQLRQATDAIVEDVRPGLPSATTPAGASRHASGSLSAPAAASLLDARRRAVVLLASWPGEWSADAGPRVLLAEISLEVSTPTIRRIKASLSKRFGELLPEYQAGRVGESNMGELVLLSTEGLSLKERAALQKLVKAENEDRTALYREFLRANRLDPARLPDLQRQFARSWQKGAQPGWYIQTEKGKWIKKPEPKPGQST